MAFRISYLYNKQQKEIGFANDKRHRVYDALATAEGVDLTEFHRMESQVANFIRTARTPMRDFREEYFRTLGFSQVTIVREE